MKLTLSLINRLNDSLCAPEHTPHQRSSAPPLPPKRRHRATTAPNTSSNASLSPPNTPAPPSLGNDLGASSERLSVSPAHSAGMLLLLLFKITQTLGQCFYAVN